MEELHLQQDEARCYCSWAGWTLTRNGTRKRCIYDKAKAVLVQHKKGKAYGMLLTDAGICHQQLQQWGDAVACYKEAVEHSRNLHGINHPEYATLLYNLAVLFANTQAVRGGHPAP
jgi:hypothetical protein